MSLSSEISSAATEAQSHLAELGGAQPGKKNALYEGASYLAVYGQPQTERTILPGGGYRTRTFLLATVTRAQFSAPPRVERKWTRTDQAARPSYTIDWVGTHDSTVYTLRLLLPNG